MGEITGQDNFTISEDGTICRSKKCPNCGKEMFSTGEYCEHCGVKISSNIQVNGKLTPVESCHADQLTDRIIDVLKKGQKLAAVKLYIDETGVALKTAKDYIDRLSKELENEKKNKTNSRAESVYREKISVHKTHPTLSEMELYYLTNGGDRGQIAIQDRVEIARYTSDQNIIQKIKYDKAKTVLYALLNNPNITYDVKECVLKRIKNIDDNREKQRQLEKNSGCCYIATAVYGSYDCPEVWTLRRYRDNVLEHSWYGRLFIRCYYATSPTLVKWFGTANWFKNFFRNRLNRWVNKLNEQGFENTPYQDKY